MPCHLLLGRRAPSAHNATGEQFDIVITACAAMPYGFKLGSPVYFLPRKQPVNLLSALRILLSSACSVSAALDQENLTRDASKEAYTVLGKVEMSQSRLAALRCA